MAFNARGRKSIDARLPNLRADIKDLIDSQSQTDPRSESERVCCRMSASNVEELLIDRKGYTDLELPSNETIRNIINAEGYKLRKVQKTKPPKKVPETDAIFDQIHRVNADADASEHDLRLSVEVPVAVEVAVGLALPLPRQRPPRRQRGIDPLRLMERPLLWRPLRVS